MQRVAHRVAIVAFDDCQPLDVVGPFDAFAGANQRLAARGSRRSGYAIEVAGARQKIVRGEGGLGLVAHTTLAQLASGSRLGTLMIAGGAGARRAAEDPAVMRLIARVAGKAQRVTSVCTGAFALAGTGLLDGRRATTHWGFCGQLARLRPAIRVEADPIYVRDGRYWTSAGVSAGIDLALALIEEDFGPDLAGEVARDLVVFVRRAGGQSQFSAQLAAQTATRAPIRALQAEVLEHPERALDVPALARKAAMSVRNFARVFRAEVGVAPATFVENVRVETARRLLETTPLSIEQIATEVGFGTPEAFRRTMRRRLGLAPREYRARFSRSKPTEELTHAARHDHPVQDL